MSRDFAFRFIDGRFGASFLAMNCPSIESRYTVFLSFFGCYRRLLSIQKLVFPFRKSVGSFRDCAAALETCEPVFKSRLPHSKSGSLLSKTALPLSKPASPHAKQTLPHAKRTLPLSTRTLPLSTRTLPLSKTPSPPPKSSSCCFHGLISHRWQSLLCAWPSHRYFLHMPETAAGSPEPRCCGPLLRKPVESRRW